MKIQTLDINSTSGTITITLLDTGATSLTIETVLTEPPTAGSIYPYELDISCTLADCTFEPGEEIRITVEDVEIAAEVEYRVIVRSTDGTQDSASTLPHP